MDTDVDMDARLHDMPVMARRPDTIDARVFNLWRRARSRLGNRLRLTDLGLKQMELVLTDRYWVCVDTFQHDCPIVAWVDFEDAHREALHEPIPCHIHYYHFAASALRAKALAALESGLDRLIRETE